MRLCRELGGDGLDDALDGKGSYREPKKKKHPHHKQLQMYVLLRRPIQMHNFSMSLPWLFRQEHKHMAAIACQVTGVLQQGLTHTLTHKSVQWEQADKGLLLLYKVIPVLLDEIPDKQVTSEAARHAADDQRQLLGLDDVTLQTCT